MKKFFIATFFALSLLASGRYLSPIPLPLLYVIDLDINKCDRNCQQEYLQNGEIFSFLAKGKDSFQKERTFFESLFHIATKKPFTIVIVTDPKTLGLAYNIIVKSLMSYMLLRQNSFSILQAKSFNDPKIENANLIIAPLRFGQKPQLSQATPIYIPTLNKKYADIAGENIYFGGLDYFKQIDMLLKYANKKIAIFYNSKIPISTLLANYTQKMSYSRRKIDVSQNLGRLKNILSKDLNSSNPFFHTPVLQTALILSQMTQKELTPPKKFSTQINFHPKLFTLTQPEDRKNLFVASSIGKYPQNLYSTLNLFGISPEFSWLSFATLSGVASLLQDQWSPAFIDHQIEYPFYLYRTKRFDFQEVQQIAEEYEQDDSL